VVIGHVADNKVAGYGYLSFFIAGL
jgi:hypothetical protein